jgi:hypothetical protein
VSELAKAVRTNPIRSSEKFRGWLAMVALRFRKLFAEDRSKDGLGSMSFGLGNEDSSGCVGSPSELVSDLPVPE